MEITVEKIKELCNERKISLSELEKALKIIKDEDMIFLQRAKHIVSKDKWDLNTL